jgi:general secretion pathway protein A
MLARPELEQLAQRVIARYHLGPLRAEESAPVHRAPAGRGRAHRAPCPSSAAAFTRIHVLLAGRAPAHQPALPAARLLGAWGQGQQAPLRQKRRCPP